MSIEAPARAAEQHGTRQPIPGRQVDGPGYPGRHGHRGQLCPFAEHGHGAMASLGGEILHVDPTGLRDPQAQQPEQTGEGMLDGPSSCSLSDEGA
jgi:hypothetical protein